jgi:hypothetical protein
MGNWVKATVPGHNQVDTTSRYSQTQNKDFENPTGKICA